MENEMIPNQVSSIWLGEARANLHAAVRTMDEPQRRHDYAAAAWNYAMQVLCREDHDAERSQLDYASLFIDEAIGHITDAIADGATEDVTH
jgi:hypothetical protein